MSHDLFISHASEDKAAFVEPLVVALRDRGLPVWYDRHELTLGDDLRRKVDQGLLACRFGVVVLSPAFLGKRWPEAELSALFALEGDGHKRILPVRHRLTHAELAVRSPLLAGRLTVGDDAGIQGVVEAILSAMKLAPSRSADPPSESTPRLVEVWNQTLALRRRFTVRPSQRAWEVALAAAKRMKPLAGLGSGVDLPGARLSLSYRLRFIGRVLDDEERMEDVLRNAAAGDDLHLEFRYRLRADSGDAGDGWSKQAGAIGSDGLYRAMLGVSAVLLQLREDAWHP